MPPSVPAAADRVTEEAADWCLRLQSDDCSAAERAAFARWLAADPAHGTEFAAMQEIWDVSALATPQAAAQPLSPSGFQSSPPVRKRGVSPRRGWAMAAGFAAALIGGWAAGWSAGVLPGRVNAFWGTGGHRMVALSDGSTVDLNVDTRLFYAQFKDRRSVFMDHGEAFFSVAHDTEHPFTVHVGAYQVRVTGTKFNVWSHDGNVTVTLTEGAVTVLPDADGERPGSTVSLKPGQQARFNGGRGGGQAVVVGVDPDKALSWRGGKLIFDNVTLAEAVPLLNPYLVKPLRLADPAIGALRIGGVYDIAGLDRVALSLSRVLPVSVTAHADHLLVSAR